MPSYAVTGASRGIGFSFVDVLSRDSSNTVYAIVRKTSNTSGLTALDRANVHIVQADVHIKEEVKAAVQVISKLGNGALDVLIANAAYLEPSNMNSVPITGVEEVFEEFEKECISNLRFNVLNQISLFNLFLPLVRNGQQKKLIAISSSVADLRLTVASELSNLVPYSMGKAALNLAIAKFGAALRHEGFTVLALSPGVVRTSQGPEAEASYDYFTTIFRRAVPGFKGAITSEHAVTQMTKVIDTAGPHLTGSFLSHFGSPTEFLDMM